LERRWETGFLLQLLSVRGNSTFGGNPMAVTATSAVLDVIAWQKLQ